MRTYTVKRKRYHTISLWMRKLERRGIPFTWWGDDHWYVIQWRE